MQTYRRMRYQEKNLFLDRITILENRDHTIKWDDVNTFILRIFFGIDRTRESSLLKRII
jgi:hypothetical protein